MMMKMKMIGHLACMIHLIGWSSHRGCISFCFAHHLLSELTEYLYYRLYFFISYLERPILNRTTSYTYLHMRGIIPALLPLFPVWFPCLTIFPDYCRHPRTSEAVASLSVKYCTVSPTCKPRTLDEPQI